MAITTCTIGGVDFDPILESFDIREATGAVSTLSCEVISIGSPVDRPDVFDDIIIAEDGTRIFAGYLTQAREGGLGGPNLYDAGGAPDIVTLVTAEDYSQIAQRVVIDETVSGSPATTLKAFLTTLAGYLTSYGVTLHASQATGPDLPDMRFDLVPLSDVLQSLSDATGWTWRIDYDKQLRMWQAGDLLAPFDIDEFDVPAKWTGDVEVERILGDNYANRVWVLGAPVTEFDRTDTFVADGATSTFSLSYKPFSTRGYVVHNGIFETLGPGAPATWEIDFEAQTITYTPGFPANGAVIEITYHGTFEARAMAEDAGEIATHGLWEYVERRSDITEPGAAQALADAILAEKVHSGDQIVRYHTREVAPTLRAGQRQTITATARALSGDFLITEMNVRAESPVSNIFVRTITAKRSQLVGGKWQQTYRDWLGDPTRSSAAATTTVGGGSAATGPAPPDKSVQFNDAGAFGGDAEFTYDKDTNSVVCGLASSITAADYESCQVFGNDCHIADA